MRRGSWVVTSLWKMTLALVVTSSWFVVAIFVFMQTRETSWARVMTVLPSISWLWGAWHQRQLVVELISLHSLDGSNYDKCRIATAHNIHCSCKDDSDCLVRPVWRTDHGWCSRNFCVEQQQIFFGSITLSACLFTFMFYCSLTFPKFAYGDVQSSDRFGRT